MHAPLLHMQIHFDTTQQQQQQQQEAANNLDLAVWCLSTNCSGLFVWLYGCVCLVSSQGLEHRNLLLLLLLLLMLPKTFI